jgi:hypothetical protein
MMLAAAAALLALAQGPGADTSTYRDAATAALVRRAAVRHAAHVARLDRYVARVASRMEARSRRPDSVGASGSSRWMSSQGYTGSALPT